MGDDQQGSGSGTVASDYGSCYYNDAHLGGYDNYNWDNDQWRGFFQLVADRIVAAAKEHGIPIERDPDLLQCLKPLSYGEEIPVAAFEAVAGILAFLYAKNRG